MLDSAEFAVLASRPERTSEDGQNSRVTRRTARGYASRTDGDRRSRYFAAVSRDDHPNPVMNQPTRTRRLAHAGLTRTWAVRRGLVPVYPQTRRTGVS